VKLPPGKHTFEFRRSGYMDGSRQVELAPSVGITVAFNPDEDKGEGVDRGRLVLTAGVPGVRVTVDGRSRGVYQKPISLPTGSHVIGLSHPGYEWLEREVDIGANGDTELKVSLRPSKLTLRAEAARESSRKGWGTATIITGAVTAAISAGLIAWGQSQLPAANDRLSSVQRNAAPGSGRECDPARLNELTSRLCREKMASAQDDADRYRSLRLAGIIGASAGVVLVGVGIALRLTSPAPAEKEKEPEEARLGRFEPLFFAGPGGATVGLRGRF
jgi:hypothetical protein